MTGEKKKLVNMLCPSLSKIVQIMVWEEQRVDLGLIASAFGLDPSTIKLNGHFISRGLDLIASSVTWKSLLSFFSARGFSTGHTLSSALIVDGNLFKVGSKRSHSPTEVEKGVPCKEQANDERETRLDDTNFLSSKRFKENARGLTSNLKRKLCLGNASLSKRTRTNKCDSGVRERRLDFQNVISDGPLLCSLASEKLKRIRDEEMIVTAPFKRIKIT